MSYRIHNADDDAPEFALLDSAVEYARKFVKNAYWWENKSPVAVCIGPKVIRIVDKTPQAGSDPGGRVRVRCAKACTSCPKDKSYCSVCKRLGAVPVEDP